MKCLSCGKGKAVLDTRFGYLPCLKCQHKSHQEPQKQIEFTSQDIKEQRKEYAKDILQSHNKGELSKEWVETYGANKAQQRGFTQKEIKNAKYVWNSEHYYRS